MARWTIPLEWGALSVVTVLLLVPACSRTEDSASAAEGDHGSTTEDSNETSASMASGDASPDASSDVSGSEPSLDPSYLKASNAEAGDLFGVSVALSADGRTLAVGAALEASAATDVDGTQTDNTMAGAGAVYLFAHSGTSWQQQAYVKAFNTGPDDGFGATVALSADGTTLAVAAPFEASAATGVDGDPNDDSASDAGAVYIFIRRDDAWEPQAYLKAGNTGAGDHFGIALALAADGNTLVIGAEGEGSAATGEAADPNDDSAFDAGAVYVFTRSGATWQQDAYLKASNTDAIDRFGSAVALSADARTLAVGAYGEDSAATGIDGDQADNSASGSGAAYVFVYDGSSWQQEVYLKPARTPTDGADNFGSAVSLSGDGNLLAVGAAGDSSASVGIDGDPNDASMPYAGAVYLFGRSDASWQQTAYLKASNTGEGDEFGHHLRVSDDGQHLAVGAAFEASAATGIDGTQSDDSAAGAGAVYLFGHEGAAWTQNAFIKAPQTDVGDRFGWSMALSGDGAVLAIGASREASGAIGINGDLEDNSAPIAGAMYVYEGISSRAP